MFRKMLYDLLEFLTRTEGIVINDTERLVHLLWADYLILALALLFLRVCHSTLAQFWKFCPETSPVYLLQSHLQ